jgi:predicted TPR repeat methyltransferase
MKPMTAHAFPLVVGENWVDNPNRELFAIEEEFDQTAHLYDGKSHDWDYRGAVDGAAHFSKFASVNDRVLDAGCGTGLVGSELANMGITDLWGCDISAGMLKIAESKGLYSGGLYRFDICATPFQDAFFDSLICVAVLTYAPDIKRVMREFHRLTKVDGLINFSHRVDLEDQCGFRSTMDYLHNQRIWSIIDISEPHLYYPGRADYSNKILVRYFCFKKIADAFI